MRRSGWCLISLSLACLVVGDFACAQVRRQRRRPPVVQPAGAAQSEKEPTVEELLRRLDELERAQQGNPPAGPPTDRTGALVMMLEDPNLASTNYYGTGGIPYFAARLVLINLADQPVTIRTNDITLTADGERHTFQDRNPDLERNQIQTGREVRPFDALRPPEEVIIPAGEKASVWLVYSGLPGGPNVPQLQLDLKVGERSQSLDVNAYERGVLGLQTERLGPENCLALLTITGELNAVNAGTLADDLDAFAMSGVARAVIAWADGAKPPSEQLHGWLLTSSQAQPSPQYSYLPGLPAFIRELHLAHLPSRTDQNGYAPEGMTPEHATIDEAVTAALRSACEALPRDELRREIAYGHRLSRAAALLYGAGRLTNDDVSLLLKCATAEDAYLQQCALVSLGEFGHPDAIQRLLEVARGGASPQAETAIAALAGSRYPAAHKALQEYLASVPADMRLRMVEILAKHPRPIWTETIFDYVHSDDPKLRLAALQALVRIGDPRLYDVLAEALRSDNPALQSEAFSRLAERSDGPSEALAMEYALKRLEREPPSGPMIDLLTRTRDPRALPLLLKHLDAAKEGREELIDLLAAVGGPDIAPRLLERYAKFGVNDQRATLEKLIELRVEAVRPLAIEALKSKRVELLPQAAQFVAMEGDSGSVRLLSEILESSRDVNVWNPLCNALRMIGTVDARKALAKARRSDDESLRVIAANCFEQMKQNSPAFGFTMQAEQAIREDDPERANEFLTVALQVDPDYSDAYTRRGHLRLKQSRNDEARADFARAVELNEFDHIALTGLLIIDAMSGKHEEAVAALKAAAPRFPNERLFEYNAACVYGRALEQLAKEDPSDDRDAKVSEYQVEALAHLKRSLELDFDETDWVGQDPDLNSLHELPEFQELLKGLPDPKTEAERKAARQIAVPRGGQLQFQFKVR